MSRRRLSFRIAATMSILVVWALAPGRGLCAPQESVSGENSTLPEYERPVGRAIAGDQFTRVTEGGIIWDDGWTWSVNWIDYDDDGYQDMFVGNLYIWSHLYHNNGDGTFSKLLGQPITVVEEEFGVAGASWADWNNNGYPDAMLATFKEGAPPVNRAFINNGDGTFTQVVGSAIVGDAGMSIDACWADYDNDGDLDLYVANHESANYLYRQDDTGFAKILTPPIGTDVGGTNTAAWADYDNDGDIDLIAANGYGDQLDHLYRNNGDGSFSRILEGDVATAANLSWGASWGDYDNDGDPDLFLTSYIWQSPGTSYDYLYRNNGDGTFSAVPGAVPGSNGAYTFGSAWGDFDNDGDLDLVVAAEGPNLLYDNQGDGTFVRVVSGDVVEHESSSLGVACADYDRDGALDIYVGNNGANDLYRNDGNDNHWINIRCIGVISNRSAVGAKVRVKANIGGAAVWQLREISSKTGKSGQNSLQAHFGLGDATVVDSVKVEWPSGLVDVLLDVAADRYLTIVEGDHCCGLAADSNHDGVGPDIADLVYLVNYMFKQGPPPPCWREADTNGFGEAGSIDIADLVYLVNFMFKEGPAPAACP